METPPHTGEGPWTGGAKTAVRWAHAEGQLATARGGQEGLFPRTFGGSVALPAPWFWASGLWDSGTECFWCVKPPGLRSLVKAARGRNCDLPPTTVLEPAGQVEALLLWIHPSASKDTTALPSHLLGPLFVLPVTPRVPFE